MSIRYPVIISTSPIKNGDEVMAPLRVVLALDNEDVYVTWLQNMNNLSYTCGDYRSDPIAARNKYIERCNELGVKAPSIKLVLEEDSLGN